jgi:glycosyltransferase involved in cell wall biosynthesis
VGSAAGGIPETIIDGVTGLLVPPGDPESLAAAVNKLLDAPEARNRMSIAARNAAGERFTWPVLAESVAGVYRELVPRA